MVEYEAVLTRQEHLAASGLSASDVNAILDGLAEVLTPVTLRFLWRSADAALEFGIRVIRPNQAWKEVQRRDEKK